MNDVGKLLWALMSSIVFVLVHLYLRLSENVFLARFTSIGDFYTLQDAILLFMIHVMVHKTSYFICYVVNYMMDAQL